MGPAGEIAVAYTHKAGNLPSPHIYFSLPAGGTAPKTMDNPANTFPPSPTLAIDEGGRWDVETIESGAAVVRRYENGIWDTLGSPLTSTTSDDFAIDAQDRPLVATSSAGGLTLSRWSGSTWDLVTTSSQPTLFGIGAGGAPFLVSGTATVVKVSSLFPSISGTAITGAAATLDGLGLAVVAVIDGGQVATYRQVKMSPADQYQALGNTAGTAGTKAWILYRPQAAPGEQLVRGTNAFDLAALSGNVWNALPGTGAGFTPTGCTRLALKWNRDGVLAVGWTAFIVTDIPSIVVRRYNR